MILGILVGPFGDKNGNDENDIHGNGRRGSCLLAAVVFFVTLYPPDV